MSITAHEINNYNDALREQIIEGEGFENKVYYNNSDTPTIGYGLALYDKVSGTKVSTAFDDLEKSGVIISKHDEQIFDKIEVAMQANPRKDTVIHNLVNQLDIDLGSEEIGNKVFSHTIDRYEASVKRKIGDNLYDNLKDSKELIALVDIAYNGGVGLIGPGVRHALEHGNRAEAWYQIRYDSNGGESRNTSGKGIANRRVSESDMFGLYDENENSENMKDIIRMSRFHADKISHEESAFPVTKSSPSSNPYAEDNSIAHQIQPAKDYLIREFGKNVTIDGKVIVGNNSVNDDSAHRRGRTNINDTLTGSSKNDLIFGENGNDKLYGGKGDDVIYGGEGTDKLYGGQGNDTYITGAGDSISDTDNKGKIYFDATLLSGTKHKVSENTYEDNMFSYTLNGENLIIAQKEDSSKSITVENWKEGALGITLSDKKTAELQADPSNKDIEALAYVPGTLAFLTTTDAKDVVLASDTSNTNDDNNGMVM